MHASIRPMPSLPTLRALASLLLAALLALLAGAPLLGAGFHLEDTVWLAAAKHLDQPLAPFHQNVAFTYFYRPVGLAFWYVVTALAGADAVLQNLADLLLQAANAALLALLAARLCGDRLSGAVAGLLFACLPAATGTAMWMSDRFDPVSLCFGLLALLAFERAMRAGRGWLAAGVLLLLALTAKETGFAVAAAMLALLARHAWTARQRPWLAGAAVLVPVVAALALHAAIVVSVEASLDASQSPAVFARGVAYWWRWFPLALFGFRAPPAGLWALLAAMALLGVVGVIAALRRGDEPVLRLAIAGAVLMGVPPLLQWPVTSFVLAGREGLAFPTNLRFYYLAMAGVALLWGAGFAGLRHLRLRWPLLAGTAALAVHGFATAHSIADSWARQTRQDSRHLAIGAALGQRDFSPGCVIRLHVADPAPLFNSYADAIVKAAAPRGADVLGCVVFAEGAPYVSITSRSPCSDSSWPGLAVRSVRDMRLEAPFGNLCMYSFEAPRLDPADPRVHEFDVDADSRVSERPRQGDAPQRVPK